MTCAALANAASVCRLVADVPVVADIAGRGVVDERLAGLHRIGDGDGGGTRAVIDRNEVRGGGGLVARLGDDDRHGVADMAHAALGQHGMGRLRHRRAVLRLDAPAARQRPKPGLLEIGGCIDGDNTGRRRGGCDFDAADLGMGMGAPHEHRVELARPVDVVGIGAPARQKTMVLLSAHRGADRGGHFPPRAIASAPALIALTML